MGQNRGAAMSDVVKMPSDSDTERRQLERGLTYLRLIKVARVASLPILAISAAASVATGPIVFSAVATVVGAVLLAAEVFAKREKEHVDGLLNDLQSHQAIEQKEVDRVKFVANSAAIGR